MLIKSVLKQLVMVIALTILPTCQLLGIYPVSRMWLNNNVYTGNSISSVLFKYSFVTSTIPLDLLHLRFVIPF